MTIQRVALYGGSFNPPGIHHRMIAEILLDAFDIVAVIPCGIRPDKQSVSLVSLEDRKEMVARNFEGLHVLADYYDIVHHTFSRNHILQARYETWYPGSDIRHVIGTDIVEGGATHQSQIHRVWQYGEEMWNTLHFTIVPRPGYSVNKEDVPPHAEFLKKGAPGSSTEIRMRLARQEDAGTLLVPRVYAYIKENHLYGV
ncbi:MAG: hypothetical protein KGI50_02545 [Patescibacteria group bacterium]|nr:hypothetical protein [Patescibacteria group bacterium]MDE2437775.1 hypothetical protein [Patescibacteria group bacterium]